MQMNINIDWAKLGIGFAAEAVFLTLALGAMLKQQKLAWKIPGLLGSIILACALFQIPYAGAFISFVVLLICITKVIGARTFTDAIFAVGVAFVLLVVFSLVAVSPLEGLLQPMVNKVRARTAPPAVAVHDVTATNRATTTVATVTNATSTAIPVAEVSPMPGRTPRSGRHRDAARRDSRRSCASAVPAPVPEPVFDTNRLNAVRLAGDILKHYFVKGVSQGASMSIAMISNGTKNYDIVAGDTVELQTSDSKYADAKCESVSDGKVVISVEGVSITLYQRE